MCRICTSWWCHQKKGQGFPTDITVHLLLNMLSYFRHVLLLFVEHILDRSSTNGTLCVSSGLIMSLEKELAPLVEELRQVVEVT